MGHPTDYESIAEKGELDVIAPNLAPLPPNLEDWMSSFPDSLPVSALSIPGTHDSASFTSSWPYVSTQQLTTTEQLDAGIRYFDLRCGLRNDVLEMVHGRAVLGLKLEDMLQDMYSWLSAHPTEAIIVQIKQDRKTENSTRDFSELILALMAKNAPRWRLSDTTPRLGELRGRIQLMRRFTGRRGWGYGIDVSRWQDNPEAPFTVHTTSGVRLTIQDHYSWSTAETLPSLVQKKGGDVAQLLVRAANDPNPWNWYINFSSAYEINVYYQIPPKKIAIGGYWVFRWVEGINLRLETWLKRNTSTRRRYGVVVMDFPETPSEELIGSVVASNFSPRRGVLSWTLRVVACILLLLLVMGLVYVLNFSQTTELWYHRFLHACSSKSGLGN